MSGQRKGDSCENNERGAKGAILAYGNNIAPLNSYGEASNLIGAFDKSYGASYMGSSSNYGIGKSELPPGLDLSLRRSESCFTSRRTEEKHTLKQSDASAFSR